ncbi:MAG: hypothetical protein RLZZ589_745, partial [Cyanobacteriota bacterium]
MAERGGCEPYGPEGLPLEQARLRILEALPPPVGSEPVELARALGRITAEPVRAAAAVPGFRASIMDGYAIADGAAGSEPPRPGARWRLVGRSAAGAPHGGEAPAPLAAGEAVRILTGAVVPEG